MLERFEDRARRTAFASIRRRPDAHDGDGAVALPGPASSARRGRMSSSSPGSATNSSSVIQPPARGWFRTDDLRRQASNGDRSWFVTTCLLLRQCSQAGSMADYGPRSHRLWASPPGSGRRDDRRADKVRQEDDSVVAPRRHGDESFPEPPHEGWSVTSGTIATKRRLRRSTRS